MQFTQHTKIRIFQMSAKHTNKRMKNIRRLNNLKHFFFFFFNLDKLKQKIIYTYICGHDIGAERHGCQLYGSIVREVVETFIFCLFRVLLLL